MMRIINAVNQLWNPTKMNRERKRENPAVGIKNSAPIKAHLNEL